MSIPAITATIAAALLVMPATADAATPGSVWSTVKSPNVTTGTFAGNVLSSVTAVSDTDVWAAGSVSKTNGDPAGDRPLIEHWNGTAWSVSLTGTQNARFTSIGADSATDAWAVGDVESNSTLMAEHWNGSAWSAVPMPSPGNAINARI
jgi:hypothetical protein